MAKVSANRIIKAVLAFLLLALFSAVLALQLPPVQTFAARKALTAVEEKTGAEISFSSLQFKPFTTLIIHDAVVLDKDLAKRDSALTCGLAWGRTPFDTLFSARNLVAEFSLKGLVHNSRGLLLRRVILEHGQFNLAKEGVGKNNLKRILRSQPKDNRPASGEALYIRRIRLQDASFSFFNSTREKIEPKPRGNINLSDLKVSGDISGSHLRINNGILYLDISELSVVEKNGYGIDHAHGRFYVGRGRTFIDQLHLTDRYSDIYLPRLTMSYKDRVAFRNFTTQVDISASVRDIRLGTGTIAAFVPALAGRDLTANIRQLDFNGRVNDFKVSNLDFSTDSGLDCLLDFAMAPQKDMGQSDVSLDLKHLDFTSKSAGALLAGLAPGIANPLDKFGKGMAMKLSGHVDGILDDLSGRLSLDAGKDGDVGVDLRVRGLTSEGRTSIDATVASDELMLGKVTGMEPLGALSMRSHLNASFEGKKLYVDLDSLKIDKLSAFGYDYTGISASGKYADSAFDGRVVSADPNLSFMFQGLYSLSQKTSDALYRFYFNLGYADLNALSLDKRGISKISLAVNSNFRRVSKGDLIGNIDVRGIEIEDAQGMHDIGDIFVTSNSNNDAHRINFRSGFVQAGYSGTESVAALWSALRDQALSRSLPSLFKGEAPEWKGGEMSLNFKSYDSMNLLSYVLPGLYLSEGTSLNATVDKDARFNLSLKSPRVAYRDKYLKDVVLNMDSDSEGTRSTLRSSSLVAEPFMMEEAVLEMKASKDNVGLELSYDNGADSLSCGRLALSGNFFRTPEDSLCLRASNARSTVGIGGESWTAEPAEYLFAFGKGLKIKNLEIGSGSQRLSIDGGISPERSDTLKLEMDKFDIALLSNFIKGGFDPKGLASGRAQLCSPLKGQLGLMMNIVCDSTSIAGHPVGTLRAGTAWNDETSCFDFTVRSTLDGRAPLTAEGNYFTDTRSVSANASFDGFELGYFAPALSSVMHRFGGHLVGDVSIAGPLDALSVSSRDARLENGRIGIAFTGAEYILNGPVHLDDSGFYFDEVDITDGGHGRGKLRGGILFDHLRDFSCDLRADVERISAVKNPDAVDTPFSGNVRATGTMALTGPFSGLTLKVDAVTTDSGDLHIPLASSASSSNEGLLTFTEPKSEEPVDPYEKILESYRVKQSESKGQFRTEMDIRATPDIICYLEIDRASGNVLSGSGSGQLRIETGPGFDIRGDYSLNEGKYHLPVLGITSKDFGIRSGSAVRFNGDIADSELDINALYTTKVSLGTLLADTTAVTSRRNVECGLHLYDKLLAPKVEFSIDVPDLDPSTKSRVLSALNTEDKLQKQFLALLVMGSFIPDEQSGIVNNSAGILYSNVSNIMASQLNNIMQRLDIPLDLGLKYQASDGGTNIFDVALSTQLFNNRVTVGGAIGNRQYTGGATTADMVGDLDIDIKLDKSGSLSFSLFSHSADDYTNYLDNLQRNGLGLSFQKEFSTFKELFRTLFWSRSRREEYLSRIAAEGDKVTIKIENDE